MKVALRATPSSDLMPSESIKDPVVSAKDHWDNLLRSEWSLLHANLQN